MIQLMERLKRHAGGLLVALMICSVLPFTCSVERTVVFHSSDELPVEPVQEALQRLDPQNVAGVDPSTSPKTFQQPTPRPSFSESFDRLVYRDPDADVSAILAKHPEVIHESHPREGSLMSLAAKRGDLELVKALLAVGASPHGIPKTFSADGKKVVDLKAPLYLAILYEHFDVAEVLYRAGANPDQKVMFGRPIRASAPEFFERLEREKRRLLRETQ
jgi:hypothetical protein